MPERRSVTEEISGVIERVTFHNDENDPKQDLAGALHTDRVACTLSVGRKVTCIRGDGSCEFFLHWPLLLP